MEVARRRGRRRKKLLDDLKDRKGYSHLKEEALDCTMWRHRFGGGFGPVVRQNTEWMNTNILLQHGTVLNNSHSCSLRTSDVWAVCCCCSCKAIKITKPYPKCTEQGHMVTVCSSRKFLPAEVGGTFLWWLCWQEKSIPATWQTGLVPSEWHFC